MRLFISRGLTAGNIHVQITYHALIAPYTL